MQWDVWSLFLWLLNKSFLMVICGFVFLKSYTLSCSICSAFLSEAMPKAINKCKLEPEKINRSR